MIAANRPDRRPGLPGRVAQLAEQLTFNQRVLGSSPSAPTSFKAYAGILGNGLGNGPAQRP